MRGMGKWLGEDEAKLEELLAMIRPYPVELMGRIRRVLGLAVCGQ